MIRFEVSLVISGRHHQLLLVPRPSIDLLRIDELRAEDFEDEKDKRIETRRLTRQQSAGQLVLTCYGDMVSL